MSFGRLVDQRVKEAAARHFDPAPIAIYRVHSADVAQSLIRHGKLPLQRLSRSGIEKPISVE